MSELKVKAGKKIFISHASPDKAITQDFIDLLVGALGVGIEDIFASTIEGTKIESGDDWRDSIKENLKTAKITFIIITPHFKESEVSLNEMGAAWVLSGKTIPLIVEPINYKTVGVIQQPKQIEKLLDEGSLDRIRDIVQSELQIPSERIKSDRWTQKKKEFIAKLKKHVESNPFPVAIERSVFDSLNAQVKDLNSTIDNMVNEKIELEQLVEELKAAKDKDAVKAILKKREITNEIEEFKELIKLAKQELEKFGYVIQKIFFKEYSKSYGITIDADANKRVLDDALARKIIDEDLELNHDNPKVKDVFTALSNLKKFIEGDKMTESVYNYFKENYECELDITNLDFWEDVFELENVFLMPPFKKYKLGELAERITSGGTPSTSVKEYYGGNIPWLKTQEVNFNRIYKTETFITDEGLKNSSAKLIKENSVIIAMYGNTAAKVAINKIPLTTNQACCNITLDRAKADYRYIYYFFVKEYENLKNLSNGGAQQNLNAGIIKEYEVDLPDLPTQTRIASILSSLDDKIELNRRTNNTLEQIAQTLFKKYFVDDIDPENLPEGWRWGKLGDIIELVYGKSLKEDDRKGGEYPVVGSSGIVGYHNVFIAEENGIVVGRKGNAGAVIWLHKKFFPIDTTFYVSDLYHINGMYYYYFLLKSIDLLGLNSDSAVPGLNRNEAYFQDIIIPKREKIIEFNKIVSSFFERIKSIEKENEYFTIIRDSLLPKLMSGEIEVNA